MTKNNISCHILIFHLYLVANKNFLKVWSFTLLDDNGFVLLIIYKYKYYKGPVRGCLGEGYRTGPKFEKGLKFKKKKNQLYMSNYILKVLSSAGYRYQVNLCSPYFFFIKFIVYRGPFLYFA